MSTGLLILVLVIVDAVVCGCLSFSLAKKKGHDAGSWFACGFFFGILGLIAAAGLPTAQVSEESERRKRCPDCTEMVGEDAFVCPHCRHQFTTEETHIARLEKLDSEDPEGRRQTIEGLTGQTGQRMIARLVEALDDPDVAVRVAAIEALERVGDKSVAPHIMGVLEHACEVFDASWCLALENATGNALRVLGTEALVPRLVALAESGGPSTNRKLQAVEALASIGGPAAILSLVKVLEDEYVAKQAAAGLERLGGVAIPYLEKAKETGSRTVRKAATKLLESIRSKQPE